MKESNATERTFQGLFSRNVKRMSPVMMAVTATITGGHCVSESGNHRGDNDDAKHNPLKPGLTLVIFGNIWMIVHCGGFLICVGSLNTMAPANGSCQWELTGDGSRWTTPSLVSRDSSRQREPEVPISGRNGGYR